jgi:transposase InsO family protein
VPGPSSKPWALRPRVDLNKHLNLVTVDFTGGDGAKGSIPRLEDDDRDHKRGCEGSTHVVDAKARYLDNIFIERLWRSLKSECVYLHAWETGSQARAGVGRWITFYNHLRPHAAHRGQPPAVVYFNAIETDQQVQAVA